MSRRLPVALAAAALLLAAPAGAATSGDVMALLNAERTANGLPAVTERPEWSDACRHHVDYEIAHGDLSHDEADTAHPTFSPEGAFAAENSVLADEDAWTAATPWFDAPTHRAQILTPALAQTGVDDHGGYQCAITFPGWTRSLPATTVLTHPGQGRRGVPASEVANEEPYTANSFVGLPVGARTGPQLLVFTAGDARISAATLTGPDGPVEVRFVDNGTQAIGEYLPPGGILVPVAPLRPDAGYAASVTVTVSGTNLRHTWTFATGAGTPPAGDARTTTLETPTACRRLRASLAKARAQLKRARTRARRRTLQRRVASLRRQVSRRC